MKYDYIIIELQRTLRLQRTVGKLTVPITSEVQLRRYL